jgi:hypothetical protein
MTMAYEIINGSLISSMKAALDRLMSDPEIIFRYPLQDFLFPIAISMISVLLGIIAIKRGTSQRVKFGLFFFAALIILGIIPSMITVRVSVNSERIKQTTGLWFYEEEGGFAYNDIDYITVVTKSKNAKKYEIWQLHYKTGEVVELDISDIWEEHSSEIISLLKPYGVHFHNYIK